MTGSVMRAKGGKKAKGRKKNQCFAKAVISFVMVTNCSGILMDDDALSASLFTSASLTDYCGYIYVTVINEKNGKNLGESFSFVLERANFGSTAGA